MKRFVTTLIMLCLPMLISAELAPDDAGKKLLEQFRAQERGTQSAAQEDQYTFSGWIFASASQAIHYVDLLRSGGSSVPGRYANDLESRGQAIFISEKTVVVIADHVSIGGWGYSKITPHDSRSAWSGWTIDVVLKDIKKPQKKKSPKKGKATPPLDR